MYSLDDELDIANQIRDALRAANVREYESSLLPDAVARLEPTTRAEELKNILIAPGAENQNRLIEFHQSFLNGDPNNNFVRAWNIPDDLHIEDNEENEIPILELGDQKALELTGSSHENDLQFIFPVQTQVDSATGQYRERYAGKLNVVSYELEMLDVVIVPINEVSVSLDSAALRRHLDGIFKEAVVRTRVDVHPPIQIPSFDNILDSAGSNFYAAYNREMRKLNYQFSRSSAFEDDDKYYILLVADAEADFLKGFMPLGQNIGYVIDSHLGNPEDYARTIAHELGHGAFLLRHTFDDFEIAPGSTDNLMDNGDGTKLMKYQWDNIHNPRRHLGIFDRDEDGQSQSNSEYNRVLVPCSLDPGVVYLTPGNVGIKFATAIKGDFNEDDQLNRLQLPSTTEYPDNFYDWAPNYAGGYKKTPDDDPYFDSQIESFYQPRDSNVDLVPIDVVKAKTQLVNTVSCKCVKSQTTAYTDVPKDGIAPGYDGDLYRVPIDSEWEIVSEEVADFSFCDEDPVVYNLNYAFAKNGIQMRVDHQLTDDLVEQATRFSEQNDYGGHFYVYNHKPAEGQHRLEKYIPGSPTPIGYDDKDLISDIISQYNEGELGGADFAFLIDKFGEGSTRMTVNFRDGYLEPLSELSNPLINRDSLRPEKIGEEEDYQKLHRIAVLEGIRAYEDNLRQSYNDTEANTELPDGIQEGPDDGNFRVEQQANRYSWGVFLAVEGAYLIRNAELNKDLWNPAGENYDQKLLNIYSPVAGVVDQSLIEVKDLYELYGLGMELMKDPPGMVSQLYEHFSNMSAGELAYMFFLEDIDQYRVNYQNAAPGPEKQYAGSRAATYISLTGFKTYVSGGALSTILKGGAIFAFTKRLDALGNPNLNNKLKDLGDLKGKFMEDFKDLEGDDLRDFERALDANPSMVRAWERFKVHGDDLATDIPSLTKMSDDLADNPNLYSYLDDIDSFNAYRAYPSPNTNVLDAVKNIQASGKLHNGIFDVRNNKGCIGHLDDDVRTVLLDDGWELVDETATYSRFERIIGTYPSGTPQKAFFNFNQGTPGGTHGPNVAYWKMNELTTSNQGVIYRSTNDPNFQFNPGISGDVYVNGVKIN